MRWVVVFFILFIIGGGIFSYFIFIRKEAKERPESPAASAPPSIDIKEKMKVEVVEIKTKDEVKIIGDYYDAPGSKGVLLLHMMPRTRKSWAVFAERLQKVGFKVLAIDLRGHGESEGGPDGYKSFSDAQHQSSRLDTDAGANFLKSSGVLKLHLVGASIGANLALDYLVDHIAAISAILLSPGLDYRGIKTAQLVDDVSSGQSVYFVGTEEDMRSSGRSAADMAEILYNGCRCQRDIKKFVGSEHGTDILESHPGFITEAIDWLNLRSR